MRVKTDILDFATEEVLSMECENKKWKCYIPLIFILLDQITLQFQLLPLWRLKNPNPAYLTNQEVQITTLR